jgi:flagellar hook-length control protein FliK
VPNAALTPPAPAQPEFTMTMGATIAAAVAPARAEPEPNAAPTPNAARDTLGMSPPAPAPSLTLASGFAAQPMPAGGATVAGLSPTAATTPLGARGPDRGDSNASPQVPSLDPAPEALAEKSSSPPPAHPQVSTPSDDAPVVGDVSIARLLAAATSDAAAAARGTQQGATRQRGHIASPPPAAADTLSEIAPKAHRPANPASASVDAVNVIAAAPNSLAELTAAGAKAPHPAIATDAGPATSATATAIAPPHDVVALLPKAEPLPATLAPTFAPAQSVTTSVSAPVVQPAVAIATHPALLAHDIGLAIARGVAADGNTLHIRLEPAELGRVDVRMSFDDGGHLRAVVGADSPMALDILRRDSADLGRAMTDAGVRADEQSFRFESRSDGRGNGNGNGNGGGQPQPQPGRTAFAEAESVSETPDPSRFQPLRWRGQINVLA